MQSRPLRSRPKYRQIADELRARILRNEFAGGQRIPGENALMREYSVARATARQALATLHAEGLTVARRGSGVFVRPFQPIRRVTGDRAGRTGGPARRLVWDAGREGRTMAADRVEAHETRASDLVARMLSLGEDRRIWVRSRRLLLDGKPVLHSVSYLPAAVFESASPQELNREDCESGGYSLLAELGQPPVQLVEELRVRMPSTAEATLLELPAGTPVIVLCRTAIADGGRPVEFSRLTMDADAYVLEYDLTV